MIFPKMMTVFVIDFPHCHTTCLQPTKKISQGAERDLILASTVPWKLVMCLMFHQKNPRVLEGSNMLKTPHITWGIFTARLRKFNENTMVNFM